MWAVQLTGGPADLAAVTQSLSGGDTSIFFDGQEYVLESHLFTEGDDAKSVRKKAGRLVDIICGICRLTTGARRSINLGAVCFRRNDGKRDVSVFPPPLGMQWRAITPTVRIGHNDTTVQEFRTSDSVNRWVDVASRSNAVADVLHIHAHSDMEWVDLYRIVEIIAFDIGDFDSIAVNGWAAKAKLTLFKHTANSPGAVGLKARHGAEKTHPPKRPMMLSEARKVVNAIVQAWLRAKCQSQSQQA